MVTGALGTVNKGFMRGLEFLEIRGRLETIQTTALLRSVRILRRILARCARVEEYTDYFSAGE